MPTLIELNNPEFAYCDKQELHCPCPKCEFYEDCYHDLANKNVLDCKEICELASYDKANVERNNNMLPCSNQKWYRDIEKE